MALKSIHCPVCGSNNIRKQQDGTYKCDNCDALFYEENLRAGELALKTAVGDVLYEKEQERISAIRQNLWKLVHAEFIDGVKITRLCRELQTVLPNDFLAQYYELACSGGYKPLVDFLNGLDVVSYYEYIDEILSLAIKLLRPETLFAVNNLISRAYENRDVVSYNKWNEILAPKAQAVEDGIYDVTLSRDVFVAYKSEDMEKVDELVSYLENEEGLTCFVAMRNLQHGKILDYESLLATAMKNCSVLVFVSSKRSRKTGDARNIELKNLRDEELDNGPPEYKARNDYKGLPKNYKKPRVEYVVEEYANTAAEKFVSEFFAGYERQYKIADVAARIFEQLDTKVVDEKDVKFNAGVEYYKSKKYADALAAFTSAADLGHVEAKRYLGDMYYNGHGVAQSFSEALAWYEQAAIAGSSVAKVRADAARKAEADRIAKEEKQKEKERKEAEKREKARLRSEQKNKSARSRRRSSIDFEPVLTVLSFVFAVVGAAGGLFSYIFPYHYILAYENYYTIWLSVTIVGLAFNVAAVVLSVIVENANDEYTSGTIAGVIAGITVCCMLPGWLIAGGTGMYGWGIACIVFCGIALIVALIIAGSNECMNTVACTIAAFFASMAICGVGYAFLCQDRIDGQTDEGLHYMIKSDNTIAVIADDYNTEELFIPAYIKDLRVTTIMRPKYTKHNSVVKSVRIPETVLYIDKGAFENCTALTEITLPDDFISIGERAFYGCSSLKKVVFNDELTSIGKSAFENCTALGQIEIPGSVETVSNSAFKGCSLLERVTLNEGVKIIDEHAFENCGKLNRVDVPSTVTNFEENSFAYCSLLKTIYVPQSVGMLGTDCFKGCSLLTIYCELASKPGIFDFNHLYYGLDSHPVIWDVSRGQYTEILLRG